MSKFRKKPVVIEALLWTGDNEIDIRHFMDCPELNINYKTGVLIISTLEGELGAQVGDYIIKGIKGEFYPCAPDIFEKTYERVEELENDSNR